MRLLLIGNYGVGNLGDELLKEYFLKVFPEVEWIVLSSHNAAHFAKATRARECGMQNAECTVLPRFPFGLRSLLTTSWWKTISALHRSDGIVFGGGTLLSDIESVQAPMLWWWHALGAWIFRKRIILAFQGIGPFRTWIGEWCSRWVVERAELTLVRDRASLQRIAPWKNKKCVQSFDPVIRLFDREKSMRMNTRTQKLFIIIPRANATQMFLDFARSTYEQRKGEWNGVRIISLEPSNAREQETCRRLSQEFEASIATPRTLVELQDALKDASFVVTQRYHGAIVALGMAIPFAAIPQKEGDKLAAMVGMQREEALALLQEGEKALRAVLMELSVISYQL